MRHQLRSFTHRLAVNLGLLALSPLLWANVNYENISFISADGSSYVNYSTTRSNAASYNVFLDKEQPLDRYFYINPNDYTFDNSGAENNVLRFNQGNYALISEGDMGERVTLEEDGTYRLKTWTGEKLSNGHYGYWNTPNNFGNFAIAWVFPRHFEVVDHFSNRQGDWVQRGNTLAFFAKDVNDVTFEIVYRTRAQGVYNALREQLKDVATADVVQDADSVVVTLGNEILYQSGEAKLSSEGQALVKRLADELADQNEFELLVSGHTDNVPIKGALAQRYATNWELSAYRAINVVHAFQAAGLDPKRLQAKALGEYRPREDNNTDAGRAANRRTEITIQPIDE